MLRTATAARWYCRRKLGWIPGMPTLGIWGSERDIGKSQSRRSAVSAWLRNERLVAGFSLGDATVDAVEGFLKSHAQVAIFGFSSMLEYVARVLLERGRTVPPGKVRAAWNGGEMLHGTQVEVFRRALGAPLLNLYGGRELSSMAYQAAPAGSLTVLRPLVIVEIVDAQGLPVPPGTVGRLIWTSTVCRGTPFLRFDVGDHGRAVAEDQDTAGVRAITELIGRDAGLLELPSGKTISNLFWNHLLKDYPEVHQFQVVAASGAPLELRLRGRGFAPARQQHLEGVLGRALGGSPFRICWVEQLALTPQGKLIQVLRAA